MLLCFWLLTGIDQQKHQQETGGGEGGEWVLGIHSLLPLGGTYTNYLKIWVLYGGPFQTAFFFRDTISSPGSWVVTRCKDTAPSLVVFPLQRIHSWNSWNYPHMTVPPIWYWNPDVPTSGCFVPTIVLGAWYRDEEFRWTRRKEQPLFTKSSLFARDHAKVFVVYCLI